MSNANIPGSENGSNRQSVFNFTDTELHFKTLIGPDWQTTELVFQTFDDNRARKLGRLARVFEGSWERYRDLLVSYNQEGAGVYLTVNKTEGGRTGEHFKSVRAVWCEWDRPEEPFPDWPLTPHLIVETSPGKYHIYWLVMGLSKEDHRRVMDVMVKKWGSDPNATDAVRVLRLPGFFHRKGDPFMVRIEKFADRSILPPYLGEEIIRAFQVPPRKEPQRGEYGDTTKIHLKRGRPPTTPINVAEIREALKKIPASDREIWRTVGMCLASTRHPSAFSLWDEWSQTDEEKYDEEDQYRVWQSFREQKGIDYSDRPLTLGTFYKIAKDNGWKKGESWQQGLMTNPKGNPVAGPANITLILRHTPFWKEHLRYNACTRQIEYGPHTTDEFGRVSCGSQWQDANDMAMADFLLAEHRMLVTSLTHCSQAVDAVARDATYDPIVTWLEGLPDWDGEQRLESFFEDYCEVEKDPYSQHCGKALFLSLVARAYRPGCQSDTSLVLRGAEGIKKTSLCRLLGGPWFKSLTTSFESKDLFISIGRCWLAELAELDSFARAGQARIKSLLTMTQDSYRPPYARHEIDQPRRTVFIGTTNDPQFIVDPHGARRFYPLNVGAIDLGRVAKALMQLFAEARDRYKSGESWWEEGAEVEKRAIEQREEVREIDPWENKLRQYVRTHSGDLRMENLLEYLNVPTERQNRAVSTRVGVIMHNLGYKNTRPTDPITKEREHVYVKK